MGACYSNVCAAVNSNGTKCARPTQQHCGAVSAVGFGIAALSSTLCFVSPCQDPVATVKNQHARCSRFLSPPMCLLLAASNMKLCGSISLKQACSHGAGCHSATYCRKSGKFFCVAGVAGCLQHSSDGCEVRGSFRAAFLPHPRAFMTELICGAEANISFFGAAILTKVRIARLSSLTQRMATPIVYENLQLRDLLSNALVQRPSGRPFVQCALASNNLELDVPRHLSARRRCMHHGASLLPGSPRTFG